MANTDRTDSLTCEWMKVSLFLEWFLELLQWKQLLLLETLMIGVGPNQKAKAAGCKTKSELKFNQKALQSWEDLQHQVPLKEREVASGEKDI